MNNSEQGSSWDEIAKTIILSIDHYREAGRDDNFNIQSIADYLKRCFPSTPPPQPLGIDVLIEALEKISVDHYPESVFKPISNKQWAEIAEYIQRKYNLDAISGHYGRFFCKIHRDIATAALNSFKDGHASSPKRLKVIEQDDTKPMSKLLLMDIPKPLEKLDSICDWLTTKSKDKCTDKYSFPYRFTLSGNRFS